MELPARNATIVKLLRARLAKRQALLGRAHREIRRRTSTACAFSTSRAGRDERHHAVIRTPIRRCVSRTATSKAISPREAEFRTPFTTMKGMIEKDTGVNPFDVPQKLKDLQAAQDFGRYGEGDSVVVNFLSTTDIIGGNCGSPILNGNGEQVGLVLRRQLRRPRQRFLLRPGTQPHDLGRYPLRAVRHRKIRRREMGRR